ncbi:hypothetical protein R5R35_007727 [Gryllus longicercus]|uniref:DUF4706 domain-containing protein n=2 Tax=Gryllus longicercus TaxID=2509291 RepID=A0AAN9V9U8_9ORTH
MHRLENCRMQKYVIMGSSPLDLYARDYFNSLNSIAEKISADITTTVAAYEDLWHTLSIRDQHQVINETIIHPEVVLKYSLCKIENDSAVHDSTLSHSYCIDDGKGMGWTDEHSAPFSWKTRSQQDLSVFCEDSKDLHVQANSKKSLQSEPIRKVISSGHDLFIDPPNIVLGGSSSKLAFTSVNVSCPESNNFLDKMKSKSVVLKIQSVKGPPNKTDRNVQSATEIDSTASRVSGNCKSSKTLPSRLISKPKNPPPPPPKSKQLYSNPLETNNKEKITLDKQLLPRLEAKVPAIAEDKLFIDSFNDFHVDINTKSDLVPKTGFDFLDNW